jgi:hypothetical protein
MCTTIWWTAILTHINHYTLKEYSNEKISYDKENIRRSQACGNGSVCKIPIIPGFREAEARGSIV